MPVNWRTRERVKSIIDKGINNDGSPGYPYNLRWAKNKDVKLSPAEGGLGVDGIADLVMTRLSLYRDCFEAGIEPEKVPVEELSDPVRIFIKWEPHTVEKATIGRWRLIWSVSLIDQIIDAVLWDSSLLAEIENFRRIPSKPGFSPMYGGYHSLFTQVDDGTNRIGTKDLRGMDWTMPGHYYVADTESRLRLCQDEIPPFFSWLARARTRVESCGMVIFSDGTLLVQVQPGINRSGSKRTISINGRAQVFNRIITEIRVHGDFVWDRAYLAAMGDDGLERMRDLTEEQYRAVLTDLGFILKCLKMGKIEDMHFCSRKVAFMRGQYVPLPMNWLKHSFMLKTHEDREDVLAETLESYCFEYAFDDEKFHLLQKMLRTLAPQRVRSQKFCQALVAGFDLPRLMLRDSGAKTEAQACETIA